MAGLCVQRLLGQGARIDVQARPGLDNVTAEIPVTITRKISGAMIILMSWMKPSPSGLS